MIALAKISRQRNWTEEEEAYLRSPKGKELIAARRYKELAAILNRSERSISDKVVRLALELNPLIIRKDAVSDSFFESNQDFEPTDAFPGSASKINILADRLARGCPLWHPEDRTDYNGMIGFTREV